MREFPLIFDSTILASLRACHRQFELGYIHNYKGKGRNVDLHAGASFARGCEIARKAWYIDHEDQETCVAQGVGALVDAYGDFECPDDSPKSCERMAGALEYYFSEYPFADDPAQVVTFKRDMFNLQTGQTEATETPAIEFRFAIPLPIRHPVSNDPLIYAGRFDAIVTFADGLYAMDEKTTKALGDKWGDQFDLRGQFCGYAWAMREHGLEPAGTIAAGVGILKTKYSQQRVPIAQPNWKIDAWYEDTIGEIQDAKERFVRGLPWRKNWSESCNAYFRPCTYKEVCLVQDPAPWLETHFEIRKWNPLEDR